MLGLHRNVTYLWIQCAAVRIHCGCIRTPPHQWPMKPNLGWSNCSDTCATSSGITHYPRALHTHKEVQDILTHVQRVISKQHGTEYRSKNSALTLLHLQCQYQWQWPLLLSHSTELCPSWQADSHSLGQKLPYILQNLILHHYLSHHRLHFIMLIFMHSVKQ